MSGALVADTGGLLRALAVRPNGKPTWPEYAAALQSAALVVVPALILAEVDYFLRRERAAMRKLVAQIFNPLTTYELEPALPGDLVRALALDKQFQDLGLGLVDGVVAAIAERRGIHRVLTTDRRDFSALRIGPRFDRVLTLVP